MATFIENEIDQHLFSKEIHSVKGFDYIFSQIDSFIHEPFFKCQKLIVMNHMDELCNLLMKEKNDRLLSFSANSVIFLKSVGGKDISLADEILCKFIDRLIDCENREFVAFYTKFISSKEQRIFKYSKFLFSLAEREERVANVVRAKNNHLEMDEILLFLFREYKLSLDDKSIDSSMILIKSFEWFELIPADALFKEWTNILLRYFLLSKNTEAAVQVVNVVDDSMSTSDDFDVKEYFAIQDLLFILEKFQKWEEDHEKSNSLCFDFIEMGMKFLVSNWLKFDECNLHQLQSDKNFWLQELKQLRQIYIPKVVFNLQQVINHAKNKMYCIFNFLARLLNL